MVLILGAVSGYHQDHYWQVMIKHQSGRKIMVILIYSSANLIHLFSGYMSFCYAMVPLNSFASQVHTWSDNFEHILRNGVVFIKGFEEGLLYQTGKPFSQILLKKELCYQDIFFCVRLVVCLRCE